MTHYNNPVYVQRRVLHRQREHRAGRVHRAEHADLPLATGRDAEHCGGNNCSDDIIKFTSQISNVTLTQGGLTFKLVMLGFTTTAPPRRPARPPAGGDLVNDFSTVEGTQTNACLYASLRAAAHA